MAERTVEVEWFGGLIDGSGSVVSSASGVLPDVELTFMGREDDNEGMPDPEEYLAAAHATDFAMALTAGFVGAGLDPEQLTVSATVTKEPSGGPLSTSVLTATGTVEGATDEQWRAIANRAKALCPMSLALAGIDIMLVLPDIPDEEPEEEPELEAGDDLEGDEGNDDDGEGPADDAA
jgi:osmotically inducible protein OsmC